MSPKNSLMALRPSWKKFLAVNKLGANKWHMQYRALRLRSFSEIQGTFNVTVCSSTALSFSKEASSSMCVTEHLSLTAAVGFISSVATVSTLSPCFWDRPRLVIAFDWRFDQTTFSERIKMTYWIISSIYQTTNMHRLWKSLRNDCGFNTIWPRYFPDFEWMWQKIECHSQNQRSKRCRM